MQGSRGKVTPKAESDLWRHGGFCIFQMVYSNCLTNPGLVDSAWNCALWVCTLTSSRQFDADDCPILRGMAVAI